MTLRPCPNLISAISAAAMVCLLAAASPYAHAAPISGAEGNRVDAAEVRRLGGDVYTFYAERDYRPLWYDSNGARTTAANILVQLLETAEYDQIEPGQIDLEGLKASLNAASSTLSPTNLTAAELSLSNALVKYVEALRTGPSWPMRYEHQVLRPQMVRPYHTLHEAAKASSLADYVGQMRWMHPLYAPLRRGADGALANGLNRQKIISNLARIRSIPRLQKHLVVDIASAKLWMYENGETVDTMRVVVGRTNNRTPLLAGYIRYAIINPYWNVPSELVSKNIATNVLRRGVGYLGQGGYQILSDWGPNPSLVDPRKIDWNAAARGELDLRIRQLPRASNAMGKVKFEFPNEQGIYLHDTPDKDLMTKEDRQFSAGCIRLEDAERLGRWLMGGQILPTSKVPESKVDLPHPVPVYLTYLTVHSKDGSLALGPDPYRVDSSQQLSLGGRDSKSLERTP